LTSGKGIIMNRDELLEQVKQAVREVEPVAEIILYGSRSRGDARAESDWDFLVLIEGPIDDERIDRIRHRLYEVEWECGEVISSIVRNKEEWGSRPYQVMPFYQKVKQEGIRL
jgi:predicted nucleotidyltransferase